MSINTTLVSGHKIIVDPEGVGEVCGVLGTNHADVVWVCSRATLINKWAKYKPVKNTENNYQSQLITSGTNKNKWQSGATWWKAYNEKFGLIVSSYNTGNDLQANWDSNWVYDAITINSSNVASHWCRLTDFNYYDHNATPFVSITAPSVYYTNGSGGLQINFYFNSSDYQLTVTDFANAGFWIKTNPQRIYCGALVAYGSSSYANCNKAWATNSHPIGTENMSGSDEGFGLWNRVVIIPKAQMPSSSTNFMTIYPFIVAEEQYNSATSSTTDAGFGSQVGKGVVPCPVTPLSLTAKASSISGSFVANSIVCKALGSGGGFEVTFNYTVTGYGDFSEYVDPYIVLLDADPDTDGTYPDESKIQRYHILNYGEQVNNPQGGSGYIISLNDRSATYNQNTILGRTGTSAVTIGVDSATYINNYKTKHGTTTAKIRVCVILAEQSYYWYERYYTQSVSDEITITT